MNRVTARLAKLKIVLFSLWLLLLPGLNENWQYQAKAEGPGLAEPARDRPHSITFPSDVRHVPLPAISAESFLVMDEYTGAILGAKDPSKEMYPASITKLMTAVVAREAFPLEKMLTVGRESEAIGSSVDLLFGEEISVADLLRGLLVASGNDAAFVLANAYPGGYGAFVQRMNTKAKEVGMENTTFRNVSGVEQEGHMTTARDLTVLARFAMRDAFIRETVVQTSVSLGAGRRARSFPSTNKLLGIVQGMEGIKTGWTTQAGECLLTQTTRDGHTIYVVILNSLDRFGDTKAVVNWAFQTHDWVTLQRPAETL